MENEIKNNNELVLFENKKIRRTEYEGKGYYSIVDIIGILSGSNRPRKYWDAGNNGKIWSVRKNRTIENEETLLPIREKILKKD